jgi:hypothetical protein
MSSRLTVPQKHQLAIAKKTLKMSDAGAMVMGGPTKAEARAIIKKLTGKVMKESQLDGMYELLDEGAFDEKSTEYVFHTSVLAKAFAKTLKANREIRLQGKVQVRKSKPEGRHQGSPGHSVHFKGLGLMDTAEASKKAKKMGGRKYGMNAGTPEYRAWAKMKPASESNDLDAMHALLDEGKGKGKVTRVQPPNRSRGARAFVAIPREDGSMFKAQIEFSPNGALHSKNLGGHEKGDNSMMGRASDLAKKYKKAHPEEFQYGRPRTPSWMR